MGNCWYIYKKKKPSEIHFILSIFVHFDSSCLTTADGSLVSHVFEYSPSQGLTATAADDPAAQPERNAQ